MSIVYVYVLDTLADWELGFVTAELNSGRFFKKGAEQVVLKYVGYSEKPIKTMGGLSIVPDCVVGDIALDETSMLLLPGADTWNDPMHGSIIERAKELLAVDATIEINQKAKFATYPVIIFLKRNPQRQVTNTSKINTQVK